MLFFYSQVAENIKFIDWEAGAFVGALAENGPEKLVWDNGSQEGLDGNFNVRNTNKVEDCVGIKSKEFGNYFRTFRCSLLKQYICEED